MFSSILCFDVFSKTPAYFGFLEFVYANDADKKITNADENDRLSSVSHSDLCVLHSPSQKTMVSLHRKLLRSFCTLHTFLQFIHLAARTRPWVVAQLIEAYQLPAPDFILSIQTGCVNNNDPFKEKSGIQVETERVIQRGLSATARITRE